jgi:hypothetical protein
MLPLWQPRLLLFVRADEAVQQLVAGSAGVSPAKLLESMPLSFFIHAGEAPALPVSAVKMLLPVKIANF